MFGSLCRLLSTASEVSCRHTLRWTPFFLYTLAASGRCSANDLFIYSSRTRSSCLLLLPEAEGANLRVTSTVCRMRSEFINVYGRGQGVHVATPLQEVRLLRSRRV